MKELRCGVLKTSIAAPPPQVKSKNICLKLENHSFLKSNFNVKRGYVVLQLGR